MSVFGMVVYATVCLAQLICLLCRNALLKKLQMKKNPLQRVQSRKNRMDQILNLPVLFSK
uniref:Uncharacterized protein n=1 Tax=Rhizophora mucronata TaxID=61149 RepID=A0A2P2MEM1_RHIMU